MSKYVSILILLDYLFLSFGKYYFEKDEESLNPYFIGLSILITKRLKKW